jgi:hypothetical protein
MIALSPVALWTLEDTGFNGLPETVYVRFLGAGMDTTTFTDDIILDQTVPSISSATMASPSSSETSKLHSYSVRVSASEQVSGISTVELSSTSGGATVTLTSQKRKGILTLERTVTVSLATAPRYVRVRSAAGKWSRWLTVAPTPRIAIDSNGVVLSESKVPVRLTCKSGACSGTVELTESVTVKVRQGNKTVTKTETVVLADATYKLQAGTSATADLVLTVTGRKVLAHVATKSLRETVAVTVRGESTVRKTVVVS